MNNQLEIRQCFVDCDNSNKILFRYFLTEDNKLIDYNDYIVNVKVYGIRITSEVLDESAYKIICEDTLECVTNDRDKIVNLIDYLAKNQVSPYHLIDIAGEYADEWVNDFDRTLKEKFKEYAIA